MRSAVVVALLAGLLVLGLVNASIVQKEALLRDGRVVHLELAPVDPRSLMQGDYMALRFQIANAIRAALDRRSGENENILSPYATADGLVVVGLDEQRVARFVRLDQPGPLGPNEQRMRYRLRRGRVLFATNAFFFQEGTADRYSEARYGTFRVADDGDALLLTELRAADLTRLGPDVDTP